MAKKGILVVTGTRAEYGLLRSTMDAIVSHPDLELKLLVTGMHTLQSFGNTQQEVGADGYKIDKVVPIKQDHDQIQCLVDEIAGIREYCLQDRPDCVLVLGDRDEPFAATIVAAHLNIPVAHIHGGDVTGPTVDEGIRHSITKFAHLHFPATKKSASRIKALAEEPRRIHTFGSVAIDMVTSEKRLSRNKIARRLNVDPKRPWLIFLQHPTVFDSTPLEAQISNSIEAIEGFPLHEKIVVYPNSDAGSNVFIREIQKLNGRGYQVKDGSLERNDFMSAVAESDALIGNSSAGIIETAYLGTPTVNIGNRQRGRERGPSVIDAPYISKKIVAAIHRAIALKKKQKGKAFPSPYGKAGAGKRIADILAKQLARPDLLLKKFVDR